jgi:hypothetical protein
VTNEAKSKTGGAGVQFGSMIFSTQISCAAIARDEGGGDWNGGACLNHFWAETSCVARVAAVVIEAASRADS